MSREDRRTSSVTLSWDEQRAIVTFDDGKANALGAGPIGELRAAIEEAERRARAIVLVGRPGCFSAGLDLGVVRSGDGDRLAALMADALSLFEQLRDLTVPLVAACTGHALAGGALMLLCADHRAGMPGPHQIGLTEVSVGIALPSFGSTMAARRLDRRFLHRAAVLGERFDPEEAVAAGFLDQLAEDPVDEALRVAAMLEPLGRSDAYIETKARIAALATPVVDSVPGPA